jgi:hypothetical protein
LDDSNPSPKKKRKVLGVELDEKTAIRHRSQRPLLRDKKIGIRFTMGWTRKELLGKGAEEEEEEEEEEKKKNLALWTTKQNKKA